MKHTICAIAAIAGLLSTTATNAQEKSDKWGKKHQHDMVTISNKGISIESRDSTGKALDTVKAEDRHTFTSSVAMVDVGTIMLMDNTNYSDPAVIAYLNVPASNRNK